MANNNNKKANVVWNPIKGSSQEIFLMAGQPQTLVSESLYHGGRGFGKSETLIARYLQHVGKGWGVWWTGLIVRREIKSLKDLIKKAYKIIPRVFPGAKFNKTERCWSFPTGEKLTFDFCKNESDYEEKYHGNEYQFLGFDELTTWQDDKVYFALRSLLRDSFEPTEEQPLPPPIQTACTTNPYGKGKGWVKDYFIDAAAPGEVVWDSYEDEDTGETVTYMWKINIKGFARENTKLSKGYLRDLYKIRDPLLREAWIDGNWNSVDYQAIFGGLWSTHAELDPFKIPSTWKVNRSFDYGQSTPYGVLWVAETNGEEVKLPNGDTFCPPSGSLIIVGEDYGTEEDRRGQQVTRNKGLNITARPMARRILKKENALLGGLLSEHKKVEPGPADNQIYNGSKADEGRAPTVAKEMKAEGLEWVQSDKSPGSRRNSAQIMIERLDATRQQDPERPHIYFFKTCRYCLKFLPELHRDDNNPDEVAKGPDDHLWDTLAYRLTQKRKGKVRTRPGLF